MDNDSSNKKLTVAQGVIDELPDDIITKIMKGLPLHEAAKLCSLSKTWFYAWKGLPELRFDAEFFAQMLKNRTQQTPNKLCNILSLILLSHVGPIDGFYLCVPRLKSSEAPEIGPCISYLSGNGVKAITIKNIHEAPLVLSYQLFSCLNLEKLMLDNCVLNVLPFSNVLRKLKSVELERVILKGTPFGKFISSCCPVLESLTLNRCQGFEIVYIAAPNLKYLTVSGTFERVHLRFAKQLISFSVTLDRALNYEGAKTCLLIPYLAHQCRLENLSFGGQFCKLLTVDGMTRMFPIYYRSLKCLELSNIRTNDRDEFIWVIAMVKCCPVLKDLKISFSRKYCAEHKIDLDSSHQFSSLRKVNLTSVMGVVLELKLIEFLLRCSPALETMYVKRDAKITETLESRLTRSLVYYRRASPAATVIYVDI